MENIKLSSENAKKYLVHALKGIGVGYEKNLDKEMSEIDIERWLDSGVTPQQVYVMISLAVNIRIQKDKETDRFAIRQGVFDTKTVSAMGKKFGNVFNQVVDNVASFKPAYGRFRSFSYDLVPEMVIDIIKEGVSNQNYLTPQEKKEIVTELDKIRTALYEEHVVRNEDGSPKMDFDQYTIERLRTDVIQSVFEICGDEEEVSRILNTKVDQEMLTTLKANKSLKEFSDEFCHEFSVLQSGESKDNLRVVDVLMAMKHRSIGAHVVAYFQARSKEQQEIVEQNPHTTEINKFNKIGNLVGKLKEEKVKDNTETSVVKSLKKDVKKKTKIALVTSTDVGTALKEGKKGPWRGYKKLYDAVKGFMAKLYEPMMAIGFTQAMMKERNMWIDTETSNNQENRQKISIQDWKIDIQPIPNEYFEQQDQSKLNVAGEFYDRTKSRLLADKMILSAMCNDYQKCKNDKLNNNQQTQETNEEDDKKEQEKNENSNQNNKEVIEYLEKRIKTAEDVLNNKIPSVDDENFSKSDYFDKLEHEILNDQNPSKSVEDFLGKTKKIPNNANEYMVLAIRQFNKAYRNANTQDQEQVNVVRGMAVEFFHLHHQAEKKMINGDDLDRITKKFFDEGQALSMWGKLNELSESGREKILKVKNNPGMLLDLECEDYQNIAGEVYSELNDFVTKGMHNLIESDLFENKEEFRQYKVEGKRSEILSSMVQNPRGPEREM